MTASDSSDYESDEEMQVTLRKILTRWQESDMWNIITWLDVFNRYKTVTEIGMQPWSRPKCLQAAAPTDVSQADNIYNQEALHDKLEEIMWEGAEFVDTQATTSSKDEPIEDIEDDLQRELAFYNQVCQPHVIRNIPEE